ncbi:hypothetical protein IC582_006765 [Cucumis melo]
MIQVYNDSMDWWSELVTCLPIKLEISSCGVDGDRDWLICDGLHQSILVFRFLEIV